MSETLFTLLVVAHWFCLAHHSPFLLKPRVCLGPCPIGGLVASCCVAGFVTEVSYFALRSITPECFPSLSQKTNCTLDANVLAVLLFTFYDDSSSSTRICPFLAECDRIPGPRGESNTSHILASRCCNIPIRLLWTFT